MYRSGLLRANPYRLSDCGLKGSGIRLSGEANPPREVSNQRALKLAKPAWASSLCPVNPRSVGEPEVLRRG
jgi:hypothetical protein